MSWNGKSPELREQFEQAVFVNERRRNLVAVMVVLPVFAAFGLLDIFAFSEHLVGLLLMRGIASLLTAGALISIWRAKTLAQVTFGNTSLVLTMGISLSLMTQYVGYSNGNFAVMCVVFFAAAAFVTWSIRRCAIVFSIILLSFFLPVFISVQEVLSSRYLGLGTQLLAFAVIALFGMRARVKIAIEAFEANQKLKELSHNKEIMFQNISHEFRTPLALILGTLDNLFKEKDFGYQEECNRIQHSAYRLLAMVNDLLELARISNEATAPPGSKPVASGVHAQVFLDILTKNVHTLAKQQGIQFHCRYANLPFLRVEQRYVETILLNLLSNAIKFTPRGGTVELHVSWMNDFLVLEVKDDGPGIPPENQSRIFDRFEQVNALSQQGGSSSGIGLALVKELCESEGGDVSLVSSPGMGSTFRCRLRAPLCDPDEVTPQAEPSVITKMSRQAAIAQMVPDPTQHKILKAGNRGPRILLVEDNLGLTQNMLEALRETARVTAVGDGATAVKIALRDPPDLIISDIMMPGMSGLELCAELRESSALKNTPLILLSAKGAIEDRIAGRKVGADSYLIKPVDIRELHAAIEGLLRSRMRLVGEFLLGKRLGGGGQGDVWEAEHRGTGMAAAVKVLHSRFGANLQARERLAREGVILRRLSHPNVVRILDVGSAEDSCYLAMEYLDGISLSELLKKGTHFDAGAIAQIAIGITQALVAVHQAGITHRDIKCENILLIQEGDSIAQRIRLVDFGVGKLADQQTIGDEFAIMGTLPYMAPELLKGGSGSWATDIYSVGVVLYQMATKELPYRAKTLQDLVQQFEQSELPHIRDRIEECSVELDEIVARAMAHAPDQRFQSAEEFLQALQKLKQEGTEIKHFAERFVDTIELTEDSSEKATLVDEPQESTSGQVRCGTPIWD